MAAPMRTCARFVIRSNNLPQNICHVHKRHLTISRNILTLHDRGIFQNIYPEKSSPDLLKLLSQKQCVYCGFDPTSDSLHLGNLLALISLLHCQRGGHSVIALVGGATAVIGDPSGRTKEREALKYETIETNVAGISENINRIFKNHKEYIWRHPEIELEEIKILNNADWYAGRNVIEFLSSVGRHFRLSTMLNKDSVQLRVSSKEGMNVTEFTYQMFQAYDWLHLFNNYNCKIQIGGQDQLGNIASGYDLIKKVTRKNTFGLFLPLLKDSDGHKVGKTAGNASCWLDSDKTSAYELYQYFYNIKDSDIESFLKMFTFLTNSEIKDLIIRHKSKPESREAQKVLAEQVTLLVHGEYGVQHAKKCTDIIHHSSAERLAELTEAEVKQVFKEAPSTSEFLEPGTTVLDAVMMTKVFNRIVDAERTIKEGGVSINFRKVREPDYILIRGEHVLSNSITLVRIGKKNYQIIKWLN